jgi:predicted GNAT family acetyltransferase
VDICCTDDPSAFTGLAADFMRADPFSTNVIGVHTAAIIDRRRPPGADNLWAAVSSAGQVVGVAMHTPPHNLFVSRMGPEAASHLARAIVDLGRALPGVNGEASAVSAFSDSWAAITGEMSTLGMAMLMYRLGRLRRPSGVPGFPRPAGRGDFELLRNWFTAFQSEAEPHRHTEDAGALAAQRLAAGELTLWFVDGEPVSLAAYSAPASGTARVGPVYTPPAHRRHGYGAAVTAAATAMAGEKGAIQVVLYTDVANPTSNSIYQSIGFVVDHEAAERRFVHERDGEAQ